MTYIEGKGDGPILITRLSEDTNYTIGLIPGIREIVVFQKFYLHELIFAVVAIVIIKLFVKIEIPKNRRTNIRILNKKLV